MSQVEVISATCHIDFGLSSSPVQDSLSISYQEKLSWTTDLVSGLLSTSPTVGRGAHYEPRDNAVDSLHHLDEDRPIFPGLPPLLRGHPSTHMRNGIMRAYRLAAANEPDAEKAFFVADLSVVYGQHERWKRYLPQVEPFYAVKCNPDPYVLRLLAALGTGFDCASNGEINQVLKLGIDPGRIIFANPCKAVSFVRNAAKAGVDMMTFDNADELHKVARAHPGAKLVVRILTDDSKSLCRLGLKFGAPLASVPGLLAKARELNLDVVGVSFHVGSGCYDSKAFADAVARARAAFDMGKEAGYEFGLLDVGGGFEDGNFEETAGVLGGALDRYFPDRQGLRIIAEPGRFYVSRAFSLAANIIARRAGDGGNPEDEIDPDQPTVMYYINDGVYGAFNCILFDHQHVHPYVVSLGGSFHVPDAALQRTESCSVWGPTCDSIDCVCPLAHLPSALQVGDWLGFDHMGAYTICAASQFNGFEVSNVVYTCGGGVGAAEVRAVLAGFAREGHGAE
ncbi:hypothetical protein OE88DRAFT_1632057 [Heliocybe sulcata]|uniref:ornithine decarboxylase n=1 Tax=Heliocybe sulcata TaxID=5364 RepID=A0A5C3N140_9AGAM|nr:hypothetical protein OE88DRAFT_1632057 [Heliocybe sulcata]